MKRVILSLALLAVVAAAAFAAYHFYGGEGASAGSDSSVSAPATNGDKAEAGETGVQTGPPSGLLYIIYDSSNSMWGELEDQSRKYEAGRSAIASLLASPIQRELLAFRAYGHRRPGDCRDSELIVPATGVADSINRIEAAVSGIRPTGKTPISYSLREGLKDFGDREDGDILLVSDGIETCDIDPCALMEEWKAEGVRIRVHVVGIGLNELERKAMACIADIAGGRYFDAGSEAELVEAINTVSNIAAGAPEPVEQDRRMLLQITGLDEEGRSFVLNGELLQDGKKVKDVTSIGRNIVEAPGTYEVRAGVLLADGSIYKPVRQRVQITEPGITELTLNVARPAIVNASFAEDGEQHRGAFVTAYKDGKRQFGFRAFDEALARPGQYEFRSNPNQDNELKVSKTLVEGELRTVDFDLQETVRFTVQFRQPDGRTVRRNSTLSRGNKKIYQVHSTNGGRAVPGRYQLHMDDPKMPLREAVEVNIQTDGQVITIDLPSAMLTIRYTGDEDDFLNPPDRAFVERWDASQEKYIARTYTRINQPVAFAPGRYRVKPHGQTGYFDPVDVTLASGDEKQVTMSAKPLGKVVLRYDPAATFRRQPDRAFITPLEGQQLIGCNCQLEEEHKVPPGRYRARPHYGAGDFKEQQITVTAGRTTTVTFTN